MQIAWPNRCTLYFLYYYLLSLNTTKKYYLVSCWWCFVVYFVLCCPYKHILFVYLFMLIYFVSVSSYTIFISYSTLHHVYTLPFFIIFIYITEFTAFPKRKHSKTIIFFNMLQLIIIIIQPTLLNVISFVSFTFFEWKIILFVYIYL